MMLKRNLFSLVIVFLLIMTNGCTGNSGKGKAASDFNVSDSTINQGKPLELSAEVIGGIIENISSPVEMASLIKQSGAEFSQKMLNNPDKVNDYNTSFKQALNLGVFSSDLGYINTFDKNNIVVSYLLAVKDLADGINVGQFFDFNMLKEMATSSSNLNELMETSVNSFNKLDSYLREQHRSNVSTLIVTGAWIEGLYIAGKVIEKTNNTELIDRLGEQKDIVNILLLILKNYQVDPNFADMVKRMESLKKAYEEVRITTEYGEPKKIEKNGSLIIVQDEISHVEITPEQVKTINQNITELRNFIVEVQ